MLRKVIPVFGLSQRHLVNSKKIILAVLCGILLTLSFPRYNIELLAWVALLPLFSCLRNASKWQAFYLSYIAGLIFWLGTVYWLVHVTLLGLALLALYLAIYFGLFGLVVRRLERESPLHQIFIIPAVWVILEYTRSYLFTGFPWALLGYSQYLNLPAIQIADITGCWGISFLVMMVNVLVYRVTGNGLRVTSERQKSFLYYMQYLIPVAIVALSFGYGFFILHRTPYPVHRTPLKVTVIQGNIPQQLKWDPRARQPIVNKYIDITRSALTTDRPDLIVWPEAALPVVLEEEPVFFAQVNDFVCEIGTPFLLGAVTRRQGRFYNSALLVSCATGVSSYYDKLHLVPFGEYIPLRRFLGFMQTFAPIGDIERGKDYAIFKIPNPCLLDRQAKSQIPSQIGFAVLICFEDLFPELSRRFVQKGAYFLANITNDAWYERTSAAFQHLQASVFRAVENRVFLVRSANTGVSGFIAPSGEIIALVQDKNGRNIFIDGYRTASLTLARNRPTVYNCLGDFFILICVIIALYGIIRLRKIQRAQA